MSRGEGREGKRRDKVVLGSMEGKAERLLSMGQSMETGEKAQEWM